jgi:hypothetical protein
MCSYMCTKYICEGGGPLVSACRGVPASTSRGRDPSPRRVGSESHAYIYVSDSFTIQPSLSMGRRLHGRNVTSTRQSLVVDFEHHVVLGFGCSLQASCVLRLHDMQFKSCCKSRSGELLATARATQCESPSCKLVKYLLQFWVARLSSVLQAGSVVGLSQMP